MPTRRRNTRDQPRDLGQGPVTPAGVTTAWPIHIAKAENVKPSSTIRPAQRGAAKTSPGVNGYKHRQQFGIVVICDNEQHQARIFARLKRAGYAKLRVVTV